MKPKPSATGKSALVAAPHGRAALGLDALGDARLVLEQELRVSEHRIPRDGKLLLLVFAESANLGVPLLAPIAHFHRPRRAHGAGGKLWLQPKKVASIATDLPDLLIVNIVVLPVRPPIQIVLRVVGPEPRPVLIVDRLPVEQIVDVVLEVEALEFHTSETI